jgi:hypothetical protein
VQLLRQKPTEGFNPLLWFHEEPDVIFNLDMRDWSQFIAP